MAQKRPFDDAVVNEVSSKHQRQDEPYNGIISNDDRLSKKAEIVKLHDSEHTNFGKGEVECHDDFENGNCPEILLEGLEETESDAPGSASLSHWATSGTSDEDDPPEEMVHVPFYSGYFSFDQPVRSEINPDDVYHCLLDYPPRKRVPIGPGHQAEIPPSKGNSDENCVNLIGTCIMPNLEIQALENGILKVGDGRIGCKCQDQGTIRCVRLHIFEARDKLLRVLGQDTFMELGFSDMGEVVADKWTNEEEQLFHQVVYSNPASMGKSFWNALSAVFPSRTKFEIVSYYFNVFMLRKRAEQNRCDGMSIDSDNDEWQGSDSDGDDDDSGIESPTRHKGFVFQPNELHVPEHEEDDGHVSDDARENDDKNSQEHIRKSDFTSAFEFLGKKSDNGSDNDARDGSCTSSDSGASVQGNETRSDGCHEWHEYILDSTDGKAWDGYNISCPKSNVDFLPTCSMIEEVFGGDFDSKDKKW